MKGYEDYTSVKRDPRVAVRVRKVGLGSRVRR
jgi:hypothetical protein